MSVSAVRQAPAEIGWHPEQEPHDEVGVQRARRATERGRILVLAPQVVVDLVPAGAAEVGRHAAGMEPDPAADEARYG
jgi:hypothetical protein